MSDTEKLLMTSFSMTPTSPSIVGNHHEQYALPLPAPPSTSLWVYSPGMKRDAEGFDCMKDDEYGPAPCKLFAIDDNFANHVLENGYLIKDSDETGQNTLEDDWVECPMNPQTKDDDISETPLLDELSGIYQNFDESDETNNDEEKLHYSEVLPKSHQSLKFTESNRENSEGSFNGNGFLETNSLDQQFEDITSAEQYGQYDTCQAKWQISQFNFKEPETWNEDEEGESQEMDFDVCT